MKLSITTSRRSLTAVVGLILALATLTSQAVVSISSVSRLVSVPGSSETNDAEGDFTDDVGSGLQTIEFFASQSTIVSPTSYYGGGSVFAESGSAGEAVSSGTVMFSLSEAYNYAYDVYLGAGAEFADAVGASWALVGSGGAIAEFDTKSSTGGIGGGMLMAGDYTLSWDAAITAPALGGAYYEFALDLTPKKGDPGAVPEPGFFFPALLVLIGFASRRTRR